jgi:hypothetical protein
MTVAGNALIGASELVTGGLSTLAVTGDGLHNAGDTATYYMQAENVLNANTPEERRNRMRKISHYIIAGSSLAIAAKAGADIGLGHEDTPNPLAIYTSSASLALNGLMLMRLRKGMRNRRAQHSTPHEHDLSKHFWAVDIPSAGLAVTGAALQKYNVDIGQAAAIASGLLGVYAFRPTQKNLNHNCLGDDLEALSEPHEHHFDSNGSSFLRPGGKHRRKGRKPKYTGRHRAP